MLNSPPALPERTRSAVIKSMCFCLIVLLWWGQHYLPTTQRFPAGKQSFVWTDINQTAVKSYQHFCLAQT